MRMRMRVFLPLSWDAIKFSTVVLQLHSGMRILQILLSYALASLPAMPHLYFLPGTVCKFEFLCDQRHNDCYQHSDNQQAD